MRWEDIEEVPVENNTNEQNSFVPQELLNNIKNGNAQGDNNGEMTGETPLNNQNSQQNNQNLQENLQNSKNLQNLQKTQNLQNLQKIPQNKKNLNEDIFEEYEEIEEDGMNVPAEVMNAPDFEENFYDEDPPQLTNPIEEPMDLEHYDLERKTKKLKSSETENFA